MRITLTRTAGDKSEGDNKEKSNAAVRRELCAESESNKAETEAKSG